VDTITGDSRESPVPKIGTAGLESTAGTDIAMVLKGCFSKFSAAWMGRDYFDFGPSDEYDGGVRYNRQKLFATRKKKTRVVTMCHEMCEYFPCVTASGVLVEYRSAGGVRSSVRVYLFVTLIFLPKWPHNVICPFTRIIRVACSWHI